MVTHNQNIQTDAKEEELEFDEAKDDVEELSFEDSANNKVAVESLRSSNVSGTEEYKSSLISVMDNKIKKMSSSTH